MLTMIHDDTTLFLRHVLTDRTETYRNSREMHNALFGRIRSQAFRTFSARKAMTWLYVAALTHMYCEIKAGWLMLADAGWPWLAGWLAGLCWPWLAGLGWLAGWLAGLGWPWLALAGPGWPWLALVGSCWLCLALAGWPWLGLAGWPWLAGVLVLTCLNMS